jgi:hypothetical protein
MGNEGNVERKIKTWNRGGRERKMKRKNDYMQK